MATHQQAHSRTTLEREMLRCLGSALDSLASIWEEIGILPDQRISRTEVVMEHLRNLLDKMVQEEEGLKAKLQGNVKKFTSDLKHMADELHLGVGAQSIKDADSMSLLLLEKALRQKVDQLNKEKRSRMCAVKALREQIQRLCDILFKTPKYYINSNSVPSQQELDEWKEYVKEMENERDRRKIKINDFKRNIIKMMDDLDLSPDTSFQRDIISNDIDSFITPENMEAVENFHNELKVKKKKNDALASDMLQRCRDLWLRLQVSEDQQAQFWLRLQVSEDQLALFLSRSSGFKPKTISALENEISRCEQVMKANMRQVIEQTRQQLKEWWDKCFYSEEQRTSFRPFHEDNFTEKALELHDQELASVRVYYNNNKEMLEKVARRQQHWEEFMELQKKAADPNRFANRGGNLLKEEKARKKLEKVLPKEEEEINECIEAWEQKHGRQFLVGGVHFPDFVEKQWAEYNINKEAEKEQRHKAKAKQTEIEMLYGSRPATTTPGKRGFFGTPAKTPNKIRKLNSESDVSSSSSASSSVSTPSFKQALKSRLRLSSSKRRRSRKIGERTPGSVSRLGHSSVFSSPVCMPPRSAAKSKTTLRNISRTPGSSRKVLGDRPPIPNRSDETVFSQTTVSSGGSSHQPPTDLSSASLASYNDFAKGLNQNARPNCRSSVVPKPQAYF